MLENTDLHFAVMECVEALANPSFLPLLEMWRAEANQEDTHFLNEIDSAIAACRRNIDRDEADQ